MSSLMSRLECSRIAPHLMQRWRRMISGLQRVVPQELAEYHPVESDSISPDNLQQFIDNRCWRVPLNAVAPQSDTPRIEVRGDKFIVIRDCRWLETEMAAGKNWMCGKLGICLWRQPMNLTSERRPNKLCTPSQTVGGTMPRR